MDANTNTSESNDDFVDMDSIRQRVRDFISSGFFTFPVNRQAIRNFAETMPPGMTLDQQNDLAKFFDECLEELSSRFLSAAFYHSLPPPVESPQLTQYRLRTVDFVLDVLATSRDIRRIHDAIAHFVEGPLAGLPAGRQGSVIYEVGWHLQHSPYRFYIIVLFALHLNGDHSAAQNVMESFPIGSVEDVMGSFSTSSVQDVMDSLSTSSTIEENRRLIEAMFSRIYLRRGDEEDSMNDDAEIENDANEESLALRSNNRGIVWFEPTILIRRDPPPTKIPFYGPEIEGSTALNEIRDLTTDLFSIEMGLKDINAQISAMIADMGASDDPLREDALRLLRENNDIHLVLLPDEYNLTFETVSLMREGLAVAERLLRTVKERIFIAETYLITQETLLLASGDKFKGYASRYERTRYRSFLKWLFAGLRTERLRQIDMPANTQPETIARPHQGEDSCPICYEFLPEEGEVAPPPVVTYECCNKPFHPDCLLEWMLDKISTGITCPMCRGKLNLEFLGEVLEMKVREVNSL